MLSAVFILLAVATLAVREWSIHVHSANLLEESRVIRAHSGEFRDYIIEQLLTNQTINVEEMEHEATVIGEKGSDLARQTLIPEEFKLLLVSRNDMTKLMARIRLLSTKPDGNEKHLVIYQMLDNIDNRIVKFDENFNRYVQQQWQAIQNLLRGFLAVSTMFLTMLLFLLHIYITRPFFELIKNIRKALGKKDTKNQTVDSLMAIADLKYIDSYDPRKNNGETGFTLEELRIMSLSMLNELPPHRGCHNIMNYANGIINCAQIMRDQEVTDDLRENESQKMLTDLWESGKKIAATVNRLRSLQQLYSDPVPSVENSIEMLIAWLELQFPEISTILEEKARPPLPSVRIPGKDLFLAMALLAEQVIPEPGRDYGSCIFNKLQLQAYLQSEKEVIIEMTLQAKPGESAETSQNRTAAHMRQVICKGLLNCYKSDLEISRDDDQNSTYHFLLR